MENIIETNNQLYLINKLLTEQLIDQITITELKSFNSLLSELFSNVVHYKYVSILISNIIKSPFSYSISKAKNIPIKISKTILISIITYLIMQKKYQSLNELKLAFGIIGKLYNEDYLNKSDIFNYFVILIKLSSNEFKDIICFNKQTMINKTFDLLTEAVIIDYKRNKSKLILEALSYFKTQIIDQERDLFLLSKSMTYFTFGCLVYQLTNNFLRKEIRETIMSKLNEVIIPIYQSKFSSELMKNHLNVIKQSIVNYNTKSQEKVYNDLLSSGYHINFLTACSLSERNKEKPDIFQINRGFIFNGNNKKGFKANITTRLKNFTIIFSFKLIPSSFPLRESYPIISFISPEKNDSSVLSFSIHQIDNHLYFSISTEQEQNKVIKEIEILPYESYLFIITGYPSLRKYKMKIKCNSQPLLNININKTTETSTICYIGYKPQMQNESNDNLSVFQGEIGTVIILKEILSDQIIFNMANLKGHYDFCFFVSQYDTSYLRKYINTFTINDKFYQMALNCFKIQTPIIMDLTTLIISPLTFQLAYNDKGEIENSNKHHYKFNYLNINQNELEFQNKIELLCHFSDDFSIFERNFIVFEFLKRDGFKFITLHLEYYYSLLFENKNIPIDQLKGLIVNNIEKVLCFVSHIYNQIIITEYIEELQAFVYLISRLLIKIYNEPEIKIESLTSLSNDIFNHLIKMVIVLKLEIQESTSETIKDDLKQLQATIISLLLTYQFYSNDNLLPIDHLFSIFIDVLQEQTSFFSNRSLFQKLLLFSKIFQVKICKRKFSIKQNYITILSNFFSVKENVFHLLVSVVNYLIFNREDIRVVYVLIQILFFHHDQNIFKQLFSSFDLFDYFSERLLSERVIEKHFNLLFQLILSNKVYVLQMDVLKYTIYPISMTIKNLIMSLNTQMSNKEKIKKLKEKEIELNIISIDTIDKEIFFAIIKHCSALLNHLYIENVNKKNKDNAYKNKNEDYEQAYDILTQFVLQLLKIDQSNIIYISLFHIKEDFCKLVFINAILLHIPCEEVLIEITKHLILKHKSPFVFEILKELLNLQLLPDLLCSLYKRISELLCVMTSKDSESYLINSITQFIIFIDYFIKTDSQMYHSNLFAENDAFSSVVKILKDSGILYSNIFLLTNTSNEPKIMIEIVFDLFVLHYINTHNKKFLDDLIEFFVLNNTNSTQIKNKTIIMTMDYKPYSTLQGVILNSNQELLKIFPQNSIRKEYTDIKCTMYFLIKLIFAIAKIKNEDLGKDNKEINCELIAMYDKIAIALCIDISLLIDNNEIREKTDYISEYSELLNKYYLFYRTSGSYENLKNAYFNYFISKERKGIEMNQLKDMNIFLINKLNNLSIKDQFINNSNRNINNNIKDKTINPSNESFNKLNEYTFLTQNNTKAAQLEEKEKEYFLMLNIKLRSPNKALIQTTFGLYFKDILFHNDEFIKMKQYYINKYKANPNTKLLPYPSQRKNFSNTSSPHLFLKQNRTFFSNSFFKITHQYYIEQLPYITPQYFTLVKRSIKIEKFIYSANCELITADHSHFGQIKTTKKFISFESTNSTSIDFSKNLEYIFSSMKSDRLEQSNKIVIILYEDICEVIIRRFLLMWQAIEIYRKDGKSFFFNLFNSYERKRLFEELKTHLPSELIVEDSINEFKKKKYALEWSSNNMSTYDYLLQVNKYASRTFNDINQYYSFPWALINYSDINNEQLINYRLFDRPISFQKKTESQCSSNQSPIDKAFQKFIGGNFSTGPFVQYYMIRTTPFINQLIRFQGGRLDVADRVFISYDSILKDLLQSTDNRELIPELYVQCEPYINLNCICIGQTQKKIQIDDVIFTHLKNNNQLTLSSYVNYIMCQYNILNSDAIAKSLPLWLDYYFGVKQYLLKDKFHICSKYSYEAKAILDARIVKHKANQIPLETSLFKISQKILLIYTLGQTPCQVLQSSQSLFKKKQIKKEKELFIDNTSMLSSAGRQNDIIYFAINKKNTMIYSINLARELTIYHFSDMKKLRTIRCKKFKLLKKGYIDSSTFNSTISKNDLRSSLIPYAFYVFKPKYAFSILNSKIIVTCRYLDQSFKLQNMKSFILKEILTDSFVNCICKVSHNLLLAGLKNGKLMEWKIEYDSSLSLIEKDDITVSFNRSIIAHDAGINVIKVFKPWNIIVTSGNDNYIFIRKLYDFELLTSIPIENELIVVEVIISQLNLLYALCFNKYSHSLCIKGYTLTGLLFATSAYDYYNHFEAMTNGTITVGYYEKNIISYLDGSTLERKNDRYLSKKSEQFKFISYKYIPEMQKHCLFYSALNRKDIKK